MCYLPGLVTKTSGKGMVFSGVLNKLGSFIPNWKARHFILDRDRLTYYVCEGGEQKGQYIITADTDISVSDSIVMNFVFVLQNPNRTLYMSASSEEDLNTWIQALDNSIQQCRGNA